MFLPPAVVEKESSELAYQHSPVVSLPSVAVCFQPAWLWEFSQTGAVV